MLYTSQTDTPVAGLDLQFYPTPPALGAKMWAKFKNQDFTRVLEPSCGNGDLLKAYWYLLEERYDLRYPLKAGQYGDTRFNRDRRSEIPLKGKVDACELDLVRHANLSAMGVAVVGTDFLKLSEGSKYSHVIQNPPFSEGAKHVLHAWDLMWDGEIVALINAETLKNPYSKERQFLAKLIDLHGSVEYVDGAFTTDETQRKTTVECVIIYLRKKACSTDFKLDEILDSMKKAEPSNDADFQPSYDVAIPANEIQNQVLAYNLALTAAKQAALSQSRANQFMARVGETMDEANGVSEVSRQGEIDEGTGYGIEFVRKAIAEAQDDLSNRAWTSILRGSKVTEKLSSAAQRRVESQFAEIKKMAFTEANVYAFLLGVMESAGDIQMSMLCDVFDLIGRYHSENCFHFRGWSSNGLHRSSGMKIKATRFVLPDMVSDYGGGLSYSQTNTLRDFDKVFAMLDGKSKPELGICDVINEVGRDITATSQRYQSSYFDFRFYKGIRTAHFYPKRPDLMDRLNRLVGQQRAWLPPKEAEKAPNTGAFWEQYEKADVLSAELTKALEKNPLSGRRDIFWMLSSTDAETVAKAEAVIDAAAQEIQRKHGIEIDPALGFSESRPLLLAA